MKDKLRVTTSTSSASSADMITYDQEEVGVHEKRKKFKGLRGLRRLFTFRGRKSRLPSKDDPANESSQIVPVSVRPKSTSDLIKHDDHKQHSFKPFSRLRKSSKKQPTRCMSADSVFVSTAAQVSNDPAVINKPNETSVSMETVHIRTFQDELFKKIKNRNSSQSEEDDGYPQSPTSSTPTADNSYIEHAITMSRRNESGCESLNSVNSSEMEYDLTSRQQSGFNRKSKSQSMSSVDSSDFEGIELSESLDSSILRHKIQVRPKSRRKSSNMRRAASLSQSNLDTLDEETGSATVTSTAKITQDASLDDSVFMSRSLEEKRNPEDEKTMTTTPPPPPAARESVEKMDESNNNKNTEKIAKNHNQFVKATDNKIETDSESVIDEPKRPIRKIGLPACFQQERQIAAQPIEKPRSKTVPVNPDVEPELTDRPKSFSGPATAAAPPVVKSSPTNQIDNKPTTTKSSFSVESGNNNNNEPSWIALARKKQPSTNRRDEMITDSLQNEPKLENTAATAATAATVAPPAVKVSTAKLAAKFQMMSTTNQPAAAVVTRRDDKKEISSVPKPIPSNLEPTDSSSCNNRKVLDLVKNYQKLQVN
ncbi:uncharacterized protein LOC141906507 isoform X2 [Tubulanus polymorphus]|uniref:uncharacterized protein LOC141906507 isoform X2 n=1 Tax=Tubulanus polymorphus TaxID=672921 RepID=UPI003DA4ACC4